MRAAAAILYRGTKDSDYVPSREEIEVLDDYYNSVLQSTLEICDLAYLGRISQSVADIKMSELHSLGLRYDAIRSRGL